MRAIYKFAVCDDEKYYVQKIKLLLGELLKEKEVSFHVDTYLSGIALCRDARKVNSYDAIFLDIEMEGMNGMETAKLIRRYNKNVLLVFITAFVSYAKEGYPVKAFRFLLKSELKETLPECIEAIVDEVSAKTHRVRYNFMEGEIELAEEKTAYVWSGNRGLTFFGRGKDAFTYHLPYRRLDDVEADLAPYGFIRIHQSYLVNVRCIKDIRNYKAVLEVGGSLPIPRDKFREVKERYFEMRGGL